MCMNACLHVWTPPVYLVHEGQKAMDPLELKLQLAVSSMWVLGTKPAPSAARAASAPSH